jgi:hypothetical protein
VSVFVIPSSAYQMSTIRNEKNVADSTYQSVDMDPQIPTINMSDNMNDDVYEDLSEHPHSKCPKCNATVRDSDSSAMTGGSSENDEKIGHPYRDGPPAKIGLYDPSNEKDACGVGMIVHIKKAESHQLVRDALDILERLAHRGACGCDPKTGM